MSAVVDTDMDGVDVDVTVDPSIAPDTPSKERHSLTLDQRRALRRWANSQTVRPSHRACIEWFQSQYHQTISQSTVSHSLSPKYARLDGDPQLSGSRLRFGNWPDVEKLVLVWHQQCATTGRHPSNDEMAAKAKSIFSQLPRYKDEAAPEFSPGWIHRFKKRYGLLIRRQRRHANAPSPAEDMSYLVDTVPRFMAVTSDTSPTAIRDAVQRIVGVEATLATCARVRDEIIRRMENPGAAAAENANPTLYNEDDPEVVLQNALRQLQQDEADAEAEAAGVRGAHHGGGDGGGDDDDDGHHDDEERTLPPLGTIAGEAYQQVTGNVLSTPGVNGTRGSDTPGGGGAANGRYPSQGTPNPPAPIDLNLTPISSSVQGSLTDRPVRCPFCVNQRMLRTIREAVEHLSTHVIV